MLPIILGISASFFYALSNVIIKKGLDRGTTKQAVFISLVVNVTAFWLLSFFFVDKSLFFSLAILWFVAAGIFAPGLGRIFNFASVSRIGVSKTVPLISISPLFAMLIAVFFLGESFSFIILASIFIIIFGIYIITRNHSKGEEKKPFDKKSLLLPLGAALFYGISTPLNKMGLSFIPVPILVATMTSTTSLIIFSAYLFSTKGFHSIRPSRHALIFYVLSGLTTVVAFLLSFNALKLGDVSVVAPLLGTFPLFAAFLSLIILRERITKQLLIGAVIISLGVAAISIF